MSTGIITTGLDPRLLLPGITDLFGLSYAKLEPVHDQIYEKRSSDRNFEEAVSLTGTGMAQRKEEGQAIAVDSLSRGFVRVTRHDVWAKKICITQEAIDDNLYQNQQQVLAGQLANSHFHTKEANAAALFNNPTSTSAPYAGSDGKALLASDHTLAGGGSFSNIVSSDLSELALETAVINLRSFVDNAGLRILAKPAKLVIPSALIFEVRRILDSEWRPGGADNDVNAIKLRGDIGNVVEWRFLTLPKSWYLITDGAGSDTPGFLHYERKAPESRYYMDDSTTNHFYCMSERYSFDYADPRAVIGNPGA